MKRSLRWGLLLIVGIPLTFSSCNKDDDPEPPKAIEGLWTRDLYQMTELPTGFKKFEGLPFESLYSLEESYTITFKADGTYERKIAFTGPDVNDTGTYLHEGTTLTLNSNEDGVDDESFGVEGDITKSMVLSQMVKFQLLPDAVLDTLTTAWYEDHAEEIDDKYSQVIDVKVLFLFEK